MTITSRLPLKEQMAAATAMLKSMAAATGSEHYGGIDPDSVDPEGFALPGGGMSCHAEEALLRPYCSIIAVVIDLCSVGGVIRLRGALDPVTGEFVRAPWLPYHSQDHSATAASYAADGRYSFLAADVLFRGRSPRDRDWGRLSAWGDVARGTSTEIPWHGQPEDAADDPAMFAAELFGEDPRFVPNLPDLLRRLPQDGPEFLQACRELLLERMLLQEGETKYHRLVEAAIADRRRS